MATMPLPRTDSLVTFPAGSIQEQARVLDVSGGGPGPAWVLTDVTPFHPVDPRWPDQGPDHGTLSAGGEIIPVIDAVMGATDGSQLFIGADTPVRRGEPGWAFVVVHVIPATGPAPTAGEWVTLTVEADRRSALSAGHTACHVAALALNAELAGRWRREVTVDGLGNPDFDQLAITSSVIRPDGAVDTYRLGKSLRKRGFGSEGLADALAGVQARANELLAGWVASGAAVDLEVSGPGLTDLRTWVCRLPAGTQRIACGGTHLRSLRELTWLGVSLSLSNAGDELVMTTETRRVPPD
jgi:alanyl-tRNA synthetase